MDTTVYVGSLLFVLAAALTFTGAHAGGTLGGDGIGSRMAVMADPPPSSANKSDAEGWSEYRTIAVFRIDDVEAEWYTPQLKMVNKVFIDERVPVTLSVVPALDPDRPTPPDSKFCTYLRNLREQHTDIFEFAQHGYTHQNISAWRGASEFGGLPYDVERERVIKGKEALEDCGGTTPTTFVPPGNVYDQTTARVLRDAGFDMVSASASVKNVFGDTGVFTGERKSGVFDAERINHAFMTADMVSSGNKSDTLHSRAALQESFNNSLAKGEVYIQVIHYYYLDTQNRIDDLRHLIGYMKSKEGVRFMTLGELSRRLDDYTARRTADGWAVHESKSSRNQNWVLD